MRVVAVVGGAGRLGRYIVEELAGGFDVRVMDLNGVGTPGHSATVDITNLADLRKAFAEVDAVIHVAGIDGHVKAKAEAFFAANVMGTWNVLQAAQECGIRKVIVTSSTSATGLNDTGILNIPDYLPIDEEHPLSPLGPYGLGKQLDEIMAAGFARNGNIHVVCIRPTYIVFPELVDFLSGKAPVLENESRPAFLEPRPLLKTYVDPRDLARCYRLALEYESTGFDLFWASAADTFEPMPTLEYLRTLYGRLPTVRKPATYEVDPHAGVIDCSRAMRVLNWQPEIRWGQLAAAASGRRI